MLGFLVVLAGAILGRRAHEETAGAQHHHGWRGASGIRQAVLENLARLILPVVAFAVDAFTQFLDLPLKASQRDQVDQDEFGVAEITALQRLDDRRLDLAGLQIPEGCDFLARVIHRSLLLAHASRQKQPLIRLFEIQVLSFLEGLVDQRLLQLEQSPVSRRVGGIGVQRLLVIMLRTGVRGFHQITTFQRRFRGRQQGFGLLQLRQPALGIGQPRLARVHATHHRQQFGGLAPAALEHEPLGLGEHVGQQGVQPSQR